MEGGKLYSGKMKPTKMVGILALLILSTYIVFILVQVIQSFRRYDAPKDAVKVGGVLDTIEMEPFALIVAQHGQAFENILTYKDNKGWREIKNLKIVKDLKYRPYIVSYKKISKQYAVIISYHSEAEVGSDKDPHDSLGSTFEIYNCKNDLMYLRFWFAVINEKPEDYVLYVGDQEIRF